MRFTAPRTTDCMRKSIGVRHAEVVDGDAEVAPRISVEIQLDLEEEERRQLLMLQDVVDVELDLAGVVYNLKLQ